LSANIYRILGWGGAATVFGQFFAQYKTIIGQFGGVIVFGFGMDRAFDFVRRMRRYQRAIQITSGLLLIGIGLLLVTGRMSMIAIWAQQHGYYFDLPLGGAAAPSYLIAVLAGLISFLSPCVLPLVPAYVGYLSGQAATGVMKHVEN
jgi:cytochrome c biogenesis protein CcdA